MSWVSSFFNTIGDMIHTPSETTTLHQRCQLKEREKRLLSRKGGLKRRFDAQLRELRGSLVKAFNRNQISNEQNLQIEKLCSTFLSSSSVQLGAHRATAKKNILEHKDAEINLAIVRLISIALEIIENESAIKKNGDDVAEIDASLARLKRVS